MNTVAQFGPPSTLSQPRAESTPRARKWKGDEEEDTGYGYNAREGIARRKAEPRRDEERGFAADDVTAAALIPFFTSFWASLPSPIFTFLLRPPFFLAPFCTVSARRSYYSRHEDLRVSPTCNAPRGSGCMVLRGAEVQVYPDACGSRPSLRPLQATLLISRTGLRFSWSDSVLHEHMRWVTRAQDPRLLLLEFAFVFLLEFFRFSVN
ncbi:hypothetical protein B0H19DRAFT_1385067 [Mycena capillaripes]|nr:hypothetical protein B0H19DRAFT_1385067 [Mycena capillaripes]